jgi:hypothetical protein
MDPTRPADRHAERSLCGQQGFLYRQDRSADHMMHPARSWKQSILEGSTTSVTSKEAEIKRINAARANTHQSPSNTHQLSGDPHQLLASLPERLRAKMPVAGTQPSKNVSQALIQERCAFPG